MKATTKQAQSNASARFFEPWEVLEIDFQDIDRISNSGNKYLFLIVDKAPRFLFAYPTKTKEEATVATHPLELCLISGRSMYICSKGFHSESIYYVYR